MNNNGSVFEDRKTALALFLCFMLVMIYSEYVITPVLRPETPEQAAPSSTEGAILGNKVKKEATLKKELPTLPTITETAKSPEVIQQETQPVSSAIPSESEIRSSGVITVNAPLYRLELSKLGGRILSFELHGYKRELQSEDDFNFIRHQSDAAEFPLQISLGGAQDASLLYQLEGATSGISRTGDTFTLGEQDELRLVLRGTTSPITKSLTLRGNSYLIDFEATTDVPASDGSPMQLTWNKWIPEEETGNSYNPANYSLLLESDGDKELETFPITTPEEGPTQGTAARWISLGDKYFMASLISPDETTPVRWSKDEDIYSVSLSGTKDKISSKIYLGPKSYHRLEKLGYSLQRNVNLGFFSFLAIPLLGALSFFYALLGNYGLAIILLTLVIKTLFLPLTSASFKSMRAMQELQPEMKALRERVKDPTQLNQEMMALYKRRGVNPMGGCLPMVIQIPVFFGLYSALLNATELRHAPFALWITDLSAPERLHILGIGVPVMLLLMGASMFLQQYLTPSAMDPQQKKIMLMMPVILTVTFIIIPFPSGLVLYWLVNNLISIVQQSFLRNESSIGPAKATVLASLAIFAFGWIVTVV